MKTKQSNADKKLILGYPLDQLLNRDVDLTPSKLDNDKKRHAGSIVLPSKDAPGTGNIIICGPPGAGKSTLALQMAVHCVDRNNAFSAFIPLENTPEEVITKAESFKWEKKVLIYECMAQAHCVSKGPAWKSMMCCLCQKQRRCSHAINFVEQSEVCSHFVLAHKDCSEYTKVILQTLSPRSYGEDDVSAIFWRRYHQIETILSSADYLEQKLNEKIAQDYKSLSRKHMEEELPPQLLIFPMVIIDSLNMFSPNIFERDELHALFKLFRRYNRIGIFTVESYENSRFDSTLADVVISLTNAKDNHYAVKHFEIFKSRYINHVPGLHPYKSLQIPKNGFSLEELLDLPSIACKLKQLSRAFEKWFAAQLSPATLAALANYQGQDSDPAPLKQALVQDINRIIGGDSIYQQERFANIILRSETRALISQHPQKSDLEHLNRLLIEDAYPREVSRNLKNDNDRGPVTPPLLCNGQITRQRRGVVIYPSLHYIVLRTASIDNTQSNKLNTFSSRWKVQELKRVLPTTLASPAVVTIEGPRGSFKKDLALSFLVDGLLEGENSLFIHLHDSPGLWEKKSDAWPMLRIDLNMHNQFKWNDLVKVDNNSEWQNLADPRKTVITVWKYTKHAKTPLLFELDFKTGGLLPEELVQSIRDILIRKEIKRVVLEDIHEIGVGYPFLRQSMTSGDLFLPTFAHIIRKHGSDLIITGNKGDLAVANEQVDRACTVSDAILSTRCCDVFGQRYVILTGGGLYEGRPQTETDVTVDISPPIIRGATVGELKAQFGENSLGIKGFVIDDKFLDGLVGFESGHIHRPGLSLHLFSGSELHTQYNKGIETMLQGALGLAIPNAPARHSHLMSHAFDVQIVPFKSNFSISMHKALTVLNEKAPLSRTIVTVVDEFSCIASGEMEDRLSHPVDYYKNVLLLFYRTDGYELKTVMKKPKLRWRDISNWCSSFKPNHSRESPLIKRSFWVDLEAAETTSCCLLDALAGKHSLRDLFLENKAQQSRELEVLAFHHVLHCAFPYKNEIGGDEGRETARDRYRFLPKDSAIYVCWYSQMRELIDKHPDLAPLIEFRSLPGKSFSGDWKIGTVAGSVSISLGMRVIDMLTSKEEQCRRFMLGVGLPVCQSFYEPSFRAWPGASKDNTLDKMRKLMGATEFLEKRNDQSLRRRSEIKKYESIRPLLYAMVNELSPLFGKNIFKYKNGSSIIRNRIESLYKQASLLLK